MSDFPANLLNDPHCSPIISSMGRQGFWESGLLGTGASRVWPAQFRIIYCPVLVDRLITVNYLAWYNGSTVGGNIILAIYDSEGNKIIDTGSMSQGASTGFIPTVSITATPLVPGDYYLAQACDSATATFFCTNPSAPVCSMLGILQETPGSLSVPSTMTGIAPVTAFVPWIGMFERDEPT